MKQKRKKAAFGGGCFWCTEAIFGELEGVISVTPGYAGGQTKNPSYEEVSSGQTGHAEVVLVEFNPEIISFRNLLSVFFATHDPTTPNRQGNDAGAQYRSVILFENESQRAEAMEFISEANDSSKNGKPVVTEVLPLREFYKAEDYHLNYYAKHKEAPYCQIVINPKLEKTKKQFGGLLKNKYNEQE